jgi:hypothetical protein
MSFLLLGVSSNVVSSFVPDGTGIYCSQDMSVFEISIIAGTGIYCSQDMSVFPLP